MDNNDKDRLLLWIALAAAGLFAFATWFTSDADAQEQLVCLPLKQMEATLGEHKQVEIAGGVVSSTEALLIFGTPNGSDWTAVAVGSTGNACIIGSGEGWFQSNLLSGRPV